jgi:hypothetical protein
MESKFTDERYIINMNVPLPNINPTLLRQHKNILKYTQKNDTIDKNILKYTQKNDNKK